MTRAYYVWGFVSSALFLCAIPALMHQLWVIQERKRKKARGELSDRITQSISLNQIASSYCAVFSFFLFGLVLDEPDPFLVYPRMLVGMLLYLVVVELYRDRRTFRAQLTLAIMTASLCIPVAYLISGIRGSHWVRHFSTSLVCFATVIMAQGAWAQFKALHRSGKRGAVSLPMHLVLYGKDFSGLMFGVQIGIDAWSIVLMHAVNLIARAPVIYSYLRSS